MKSNRLFILLILTLSLRLPAQKPDTAQFESVPPYYFHLYYLKTDPALMVDVREFFEYRGSRIQDAVNIPSSGNLEFSADTIKIDVALFLYCTTGFRSDRAAAFFADHGFRKVYSLDGGIVAWKKDGFPIEKKKLKRIKKTKKAVR